MLKQIGSVFYEDHARKIPKLWDQMDIIIPKLIAQGFANKFYLQFTHEPIDYRGVLESEGSPWFKLKQSLGL